MRYGSKNSTLAGRTLLKKLKNKEKFVFITTLLENQKRAKNDVQIIGYWDFLDFDADQMYGTLMSQPDS